MFSEKELKEYSEKYLDYIKALREKLIISDELENDFCKLLKSPNLVKRRELWIEIRKNESYKKELKHLANPFFIGYGDPDSNILFLGKEKAFNIDPDEHHLFLRESINNILQWKKIETGKEEQLEDFNPKLPKGAFPKMNYKETWGTYCKIIKGLFGDNYTFNEIEDSSKSFFGKCFLTEINYQPSKYSEGDHKRHYGYKKRQQFLKEAVLPNFRVLIIGAASYFTSTDLEKLKVELSALFGEVEVCEESYYIDRFINPFQHFRTVDRKQDIFLTTQLSGMNRWDEFKLNAFVKRIKISTPELR